MSIYAYCITSSTLSIPPKGVLEKPIRSIVFENIHLIVSEFSTLEISAIPLAQALIHDEVITYFLKDGSVLPLRWMTLFESEEDCKAMLQKNKKTICEKLLYFENLVEFGVKVIFPNNTVDLIKNSTEINLKNKEIENYLKAKLQKYQRNQAKEQYSIAFEKLVKELIYPTTKDFKSLTPSNTIDWQAVFLVEKNKIEIFRQNIVLLRQKFINLRLMLSGDWAAYHFVDLILKI